MKERARIMSPLLKVCNLTFSYDGLAQAVSDISFTLEEGSITGLMGLNGSGKSTLIKNVFDLVKMQSGSVSIAGHPHQSPKAKASAAYLASNDYLPEFLTAREYLSFLARSYGIDADHDMARELFRGYAMGGRYDHLIEDYSHGMRKKTQLIAALVLARPLTVIDETLNGVDVEALRLAEQHLDALRSDGKGVLLCSHDFPLLERLCDRVVFLERGRVMTQGTVADLTQVHGSLSDLVFGYLEGGS